MSEYSEHGNECVDAIADRSPLSDDRLNNNHTIWPDLPCASWREMAATLQLPTQHSYSTRSRREQYPMSRRTGDSALSQGLGFKGHGYTDTTSLSAERAGYGDPPHRSKSRTAGRQTSATTSDAVPSGWESGLASRYASTGTWVRRSAGRR
jgi:hypothetical protein